MRIESVRVVATRACLLLLALLFFTPACALLGVEDQRERAESLGRIRGSVRIEPASDSPIVVVLGRASGGVDDIDPKTGRRAGYVVDHYPLERAGNFAFLVSAGSFRLIAFADRNGNMSYEPGEPVVNDQPVFDMAPGTRIDNVELVIPEGSILDQRYDIAALQARAPIDQQNFSLGRFTVKSDVVHLDDPKFGPEIGRMGMWRFADFLFEIGPGVYFLEPYDAKKIPVLFVHGIGGYPQQFSSLIAKLDRERFQPWFYFYPSGFHLDGLAQHLTAVITELQARHDFDELAVVAHSMGGLVSRAFILQYARETGRQDIKLFVAISSPWGGSESAAKIENAPEDLVVYSWLDMNPAGPFLRNLFYTAPDYRKPRPLPEDVEFHMLFGYQRKDGSLGPSGDGTLTVRSEARIEAVEAAKSVLPLDYDHVGILHSPEAAARLDRILHDTFGDGR